MTEEKSRSIWKEYRMLFDAAGNEEDYLLLMDENQQQTDFSMPLRNMLNTALAYMQQKKQIEELHRQRHDLKSGSEYLSGFAEQDRLHPVICIIFTMGKSRGREARAFMTSFGFRLGLMI